MIVAALLLFALVFLSVTARISSEAACHDGRSRIVVAALYGDFFGYLEERAPAPGWRAWWDAIWEMRTRRRTLAFASDRRAHASRVSSQNIAGPARVAACAAVAARASRSGCRYFRACPATRFPPWPSIRSRAGQVEGDVQRLRGLDRILGVNLHSALAHVDQERVHRLSGPCSSAIPVLPVRRGDSGDVRRESCCAQRKGCAPPVRLRLVFQRRTARRVYPDWTGAGRP